MYYSRNSNIKYIDFESFHYTINLNASSSYMVFILYFIDVILAGINEIIFFLKKKNFLKAIYEIQ